PRRLRRSVSCGLGYPRIVPVAELRGVEVGCYWEMPHIAQGRAAGHVGGWGPFRAPPSCKHRGAHGSAGGATNSSHFPRALKVPDFSSQTSQAWYVQPVGRRRLSMKHIGPVMAVMLTLALLVTLAEAMDTNAAGKCVALGTLS